MLRGGIKTWMTERGFGFVERDDGEGSLFVHITQLEDDLEELLPGTEIEFEVGTSARNGRPEAQHVRLA